MRFSYSVIGDNTQENREWLEKLGYVNFDYNFKGTHIISYWSERYKNNYYQCVTYHELISLRMYESSINCIGNSSLFKAVSAMREDSDFGQLFGCKDGLFICQHETSREHIDKWCKGWDVTGLKKYNLPELQEKFKL